MSDPYIANLYLESVIDFLAGDESGLEAACAAFESTPGDFSARFAAAVRAHATRAARAEVFIEIPKDPEALRRGELEALVRPVADGFLRSNPSKAELLDQVSRIDRRQKKRPDWIPRVDRDGRPLKQAADEPAEYERWPDRTVTVSTLVELGDVAIVLPEAGDDDVLRLDMAAGGIGEWESALYALLGLTGPHTPDATVELNAGANMALVPEEARWWPPELADALPASEDPGVASELLATSTTLGGLQVAENTNTLEAFETVADGLVGVGDWRYSPRWRLESWGPGDDMAIVASARAAIAGWAHDERSGLIVYVYGGSLHEEEGQSGYPIPLHSYLLTATRAADGTDTVEAVHRVVLSCPGEDWCHAGGCSTPEFSAAEGLLRGIATAGDAMSAVFGAGGSAAQTYRALYGSTGSPECPNDVLEHVTHLLDQAGWSELSTSEWEGGVQETLLRREDRCASVHYDPVTRQLRLDDGHPELETMLQLLGDDEVLVQDGDHERIDFEAATAKRWDTDLLTAAEDLLRGRITKVTDAESSLPVQTTIIGLHPHADGTLRAPESFTLADSQISTQLRKVGVIPRKS